jgi:very-short-patch-repair endonuclease
LKSGELNLGEPGGSRTEIAKRIRRAKAAKNARFENELAFQIRTRRLPEPETQFYFAAEIKRRFSSDFAWPEFRLLVEIQGGIWMRGGGGHSHPMHIEKDVERQQVATLLGWHLLPVTTDQVRKGEAIEILIRVLMARGWKAAQ